MPSVDIPYGIPTYGGGVYYYTPCEVQDQYGRCAVFDDNGNIIGFSGVGADDQPMSTTTMLLWGAAGVVAVGAAWMLLKK